MRLTIYCFIVFALLGEGCKQRANPVVPEQLPPFLYGRVVDEAGYPLDSVGVHYLFNTEPTPIYRLSKTYPSTTVRYSIPARSHVSLKIFRWYTMELIATLVDDTLDAGTYQVQFNAAGITNGVYVYRIVAGTYTEEKRMLLVNLDLPTLTASTPLTVTKTEGNFSLPNAIFGIGLTTVRSDGTGAIIDTVHISKNIQIVLHKPGYQILTQTLTIDTLNGLKKTFTLAK